MNTSFRKGQNVSVRLHGGSVVTRRVWSEDEKAVFLCSNEQYEALKAGHDAPPPIGFPRSDVQETA